MLFATTTDALGQVDRVAAGLERGPLYFAAMCLAAVAALFYLLMSAKKDIRLADQAHLATVERLQKEHALELGRVHARDHERADRVEETLRGLLAVIEARSKAKPGRTKTRPDIPRAVDAD